MKRFLVLLLCLVCSLCLISAHADLKMPASLTIIDEEAFAGNPNISGLLEIYGNVSRIEAGAFSDTNLTALELSENVTFIGDNIVGGSPVTYVAVLNESAQLSENALDGVPVILSWPGDAACQWAEAHGVEWYDCNEVTPYGDFYYAVHEDGTAKLLFAKNTDSVSASVKIPMTVNGATVTEMSEHAFAHCNRIESVSIPDTVSIPSDVNNWPELDISVYATSADPVLPEEESIALTMDEPRLILPIDYSEWIWSSSFDEVLQQLDDNEERYIMTWYSSDDSIVNVDQNGKFTTKALGNAAITCVIRSNDEIYTGVVQINVVEPELTIENAFNDATTLKVGETSLVAMRFDTNLSRRAPFNTTMTFTSSNEEIFTCDQGGMTGVYLTGVSAGEATLHVSTFAGGKEFTLDLSVIVTETGYYLNIPGRFYTHTGVEEQLVLLGGDLPEGASVRWFSEDEEIAAIDENGVLIIHAEYIPVNVGCEITYANGETEQVVSTVTGLDANPYIDIYEDPMHFYEGQSGSIEDMPFMFDYHWWTYDSFKQPEFVYEFTGYDESVITFEDGKFYAHSEGTTDVHLKASADDISAEADFTVEVYAPYFDVWMQDNLIELNIDQTDFHIDFGIDSELPVRTYNFTSSNPEVVKVTADGLLLPVSEGDAVITLTVEAANGHKEVRTVDVHVYGSSFIMEDEEITLNVGESYTIVSIPEIPEDHHIADDHFWSDDDSIAYVDNAEIIGVSAGSVYIWHEVRLDDDSRIIAKTLVNVVDPEYPIQLNTTSLTLGRYETFQLKAEFSGEATDIRWYSENPDETSVDDNGVVTQYGAWNTNNSTRIWCETEIDGETYAASCRVSFAPFRAQVNWFPGQLELGIDDSCDINDWFMLSVADPDLEVEFVWTTDDESIAKFTEPGVLTGISSGVTDFTLTLVDAKDGSFVYRESGKAFVNVAPEAPESIRFESAGYLLTMPGGRYEGGHAHVVFDSEYEWDRNLLRYSSDNEDVVRINENGDLEPVGVGVANIEVTMPMFGLSDTAPVIVSEDVEFYLSKEEVCVGEELVFGLRGIPEEAIYDVQLKFCYDTNIFRLTEDTDSGFYLKAIRRDGGEISADLYVFGEHYDSFNTWIHTYSPEHSLNETVMYLTVGDEHDLCPEFDRNPETDAWASTDEDVAIYDEEHARVIAVGPGTCTIGYHGYDWEGNEISACCGVTVTETCEWTLRGMNVPDVMVLGRTYGLYEDVETVSWIGPDVEFTSSNPDVVFVNIQDDCFNAVGVGTTEITCIATKHGETQTVTKTVRVIDVPLRMADDYTIELRPGQTKKLSVIAGQGKEIESIEWTSNSAVVSVDQEGNITAEAEDGHASVYATATFTDGTTASAHAYVTIVRNDEVWFNMGHMDDQVELSTNEVNHPSSVVWYADFFTNASLEDLTIEWISHNEEVVHIGETDAWYMDNGDGRTTSAVIEAVGEGEADIELVIHNDELGIWDSRWLHVRVYEPVYEIYPYETEYTVMVGQSFMPGFEEHVTEGFGDIGPRVYTSSDESIARVTGFSDVQGIAPGTATITYTVYCYGEVLASQEYTVHVIGATLNETSLELNEGDSFQLIPELTGFEHYNGYDWGTTNPDVAAISNDGCVVAVSAGKATVFYHAHGERGETYVYCDVTVLGDETSDFYLTESFIELPSFQHYQLTYISELGTPDSIKWHTDGWGSINEDGLLYVDGVGEYRYVTVTCTAAFGDVTYTDSCTVKIVPPEVIIFDFGGAMNISAGHKEYQSVHYTTGSEIEEIFYISEDESIAAWGFYDNGDPYIEGVGEGVTNVRFVVRTVTGFEYSSGNMAVCVNTPLPEIEKVECEVGTLLLFQPGHGPFDRDIPMNVYPEHCSYELKSWSDNPDIASVDGTYVAANNAGETTLHFTFTGHEDLNFDLPVFVPENGTIAFNVSQEPVNVGEEYTVTVGSLIDHEDGSTSFVEWPKNAYDLYCDSGWDHEDYRFNDEDTFYAARPGEYDFHARIDMRHGFQLEDHCYFTVQAEEEYIINWHTDDEALVHPGQEFWPDYRANFNVHGIAVSTDDPEIVAAHENGDHWIALKEGTATVHYQAMREDGSLHPTVLTQVFTVKEPEEPIISLNIQRTLRVGETVPLWVNIENHYYNGADWQVASSNPEILTFNDWNPDWNDHTVTAHSEGTVELTVTAWYGNSVTTKTFSIEVIGEAPAWVSSGDFELRCGDTKQLYMHAAEGMTIESVEWVSSNPDVISVDEDGYVTAHASEGRVAILGYVTFDDSSVYTTHTTVNIPQDWNLWLDFHNRPNNMTLGLNDSFGPAPDEWAYAYFNTNWGSNELSVEWTIDNEGVVRIGDEEGDEKFFFNNDDYNYFAYEAHAHLIAVATGNTDVHIIIRVNGEEVDRHTFNVEVIDPYFEIVSDEDEVVILRMNETRGLNYHWDSSWDFGQFSYHTLKSNREDIVKVNVDSELLGIAPGTATVTVAAYADNGLLMDTQDFTVEVVSEVTLNATELVLDKGDAFNLIPHIFEGVKEDESFHFTGWYSDADTVATISNEGTVIGVSVGVTHVYYTYDFGGEHYEVRCVVTVPDSHVDFNLNRSSIAMSPGHSFTLEIVNHRGEPDKIEWLTNCDCLVLEVSEDGSSCVVAAPLEDHFDHTLDAVYCRATFGDEVVYGICRVKALPATIYLDDIDRIHSISAGDEHYIPIQYRVVGDMEIIVSDEDVWFEVSSDNPDIAELVMYDDRHIHLRAYNRGVTDVHIKLNAADGSWYERTMTVYVDEPLPEIESFEILERPFVLDDPEYGESTGRWIPWVCEPEVPCHVVFSTEDTDIISCTEDGWIEAQTSGRAIVHAEVVDYPHLSRDFFVLVIGDFGFVGPEDNTMQSGEQAQLSIDGDYWNAYDLNVSFGTEAEWHQITVSEDGLVTAREPGDYTIYASIEMFDGGALVREYKLNVTRGEQFFYMADPTFVMYEGQGCGLSRISSYYPEGEEPEIVFEPENTDVALGGTEYGDLYAVAEGNTTVNVTLICEDGTEVPSSNSINLTVLPAQELPIWMGSKRAVCVGETIDVWIDGEYESSHFPFGYHCESSDESILSVSEGNKITGVKPGEVRLTIHAYYGNIEQTTEATIFVVQ